MSLEANTQIQLPSESELKQVVASFVDTNTLVRHQIESFDHFMNVLVPHIIYENSDIIVESKKNKVRHEIRFKNVMIQEPRIKESNGESRKIYPHECRARSVTYQCSIFVDVEHLVYAIENETSSEDENDEEEQLALGSKTEVGKTTLRLIQNNYYREIKIGKIPTMVQSQFCNLSNSDSIARECPYDWGGYFIMNGTEKVIISQERMRINYPYILAQKAKSKYAYVCEVRSCHESKLRSTSTLYVYITGGKGFNNPEIFVRVPFVDFYIPLIVIFKILGFNSMNEIFNLILDSVSSDDIQLINLVKSLIENDIYDNSVDKLYNFIGKMGTKEPVEEKRIKAIDHIFGNEFLPHIGLERDRECLTKKAIYLGFIVKLLCLTHLGRKGFEPDDRDHYKTKRIETTGKLMGNQKRYLWRAFMRNVSTGIKKSVDSTGNVDVVDIIEKRKEKITTGLKYALSTGKWGPQKGGSPQTGVAQIHSPMTLASCLSNKRRINTHIHKEGKLPRSRQLHLSHWAKVCASQTPEGIFSILHSFTQFIHTSKQFIRKIMFDA